MQQNQVQGLVLDTASLEQSRGPRWYLQDENSTDASSNADLGIENIVLTPATSQAQLDAGAIGQVALHTTIGSFYMTAFRGKQDAGSVRLALPSRDYMDNGVKKYQDVYSLRPAIRAQVLKFVHSKCKEAQVAKQEAQPQAQANPALQALAGLDAETIAKLLAVLGVSGGAGAQAQSQEQAQPQAQAQADASSVPPIITEGAF